MNRIMSVFAKNKHPEVKKSINYVSEFQASELIGSVQPQIKKEEAKFKKYNLKELGVSCFQQVQPLRELLHDYINYSSTSIVADLEESKIALESTELCYP